MAANRNRLGEIEGQWNELVRHPGQFAGQRVRVTVLSDDAVHAPAIAMEIRHWLAEGDAIEIAPGNLTSNTLGDLLIEKYHKHGLGTVMLIDAGPLVSLCDKQQPA